LPRTEELGKRQLSLPFYPSMEFDQVELVVGTLQEALATPA
jgi:dTDP-4-amino-4,6-dideoxygalactose transaminase